MSYQPKTGRPCHCKCGVQRDNCPDCEGTGQQIDFAKIRLATKALAEPKPGQSLFAQIKAAGIPYTVLLMLPDYACDTYGENELVLVRAKNSVEAVTKAQSEVAAKMDDVEPQDLAPIAVFSGAHRDLISEWARAQTLKGDIQE